MRTDCRGRGRPSRNPGGVSLLCGHVRHIDGRDRRRQYQAIFDRDVRNCAYFATLGDRSAAAPGTRQIALSSAAANVNGVRVVTRKSAGEPADRSFHLTVCC